MNDHIEHNAIVNIFVGDEGGSYDVVGLDRPSSIVNRRSSIVNRRSSSVVGRESTVRSCATLSD